MRRGPPGRSDQRDGRHGGSGCRWPQVFHTQGIRLRPMTLFNPVFNCVTPKVIKRLKTQADEGLTPADEAGYVVLRQPPASKLANLFRIDVLSWSGHRSVLSWPWKESLRVHGIPPRSLSRSRPGCRRLVVIPTGILDFNRGKTGLTTQENGQSSLISTVRRLGSVSQMGGRPSRILTRRVSEGSAATTPTQTCGSRNPR